MASRWSDPRWRWDSARSALHPHLITAIFASGILSLEAELFSLDELAHHVLAAFRARAPHKGVTLRHEFAPGLAAPLRAPVNVIGVIPHALLDNAVKFTSDGESCLTVEVGDSRLIFHVRDTRCGLTPEQQAWIAQPFAKVDGGLSRRNSGIGLGLPLVRRLTTHAGGEFRLSARREGGTVVTFSTRWSR